MVEDLATTLYLRVSQRRTSDASTWKKDMSPSRINRPNGLAVLKNLGPADKLASAAAATGLILVVFGIVLQENLGVGFGATIRMLGGAFFLGGLGTLLLWESHRRAALLGAARRIVERYMAATVAWRWTDRMGLAGVAIGLALLAPALVLQIIFGTVFGAIVIAPGIVLFWTGIALLVYGRFRRREARQHSSPSGREGRGRGRGD